MQEIIDATYKFLDDLDNSYLIKNLIKYKENILNDKELLSKIAVTKKETNNNIIISNRKEIFDNYDYKMYMKYYNELSLIILKINNQYKRYTSTKKHNCI